MVTDALRRRVRTSSIVQFTYHGSPMRFDCFTLDPSGIPTGPITTVPGGFGLPASIATAGKHDDVNGNGRIDFADVVRLFTSP